MPTQQDSTDNSYDQPQVKNCAKQVHIPFTSNNNFEMF